jgi:hypothetical protein
MNTSAPERMPPHASAPPGGCRPDRRRRPRSSLRDSRGAALVCRCRDLRPTRPRRRTDGFACRTPQRLVAFCRWLAFRDPQAAPREPGTPFSFETKACAPSDLVDVLRNTSERREGFGVERQCLGKVLHLQRSAAQSGPSCAAVVETRPIFLGLVPVQQVPIDHGDGARETIP